MRMLALEGIEKLKKAG
jgi:hypothetical protein